MTALRFALRNLLGWHPRTLGALAGITIAVATLVALIGLARGVENALSSALSTRGTDAVVTEAGALDMISSIVPDTLGNRLGEHPGVLDATPELTRLTTLGDGRSVVVAAWPLGTRPWQSFDGIEGRLPGPDDGFAAVIGEGLAERGGFALGDPLWLFQERFEIVGIARAQSVLARGLVYIPLPVAQALTYREGQATSIGLRLAPGAQGETLAALRTGFDDYNIEATDTLSDSYLFGRIAEALALTISAVAMLSAALAIYTTMSTAVIARRGEIAILSAIGWARGRILRALMFEGLLLSLFAGCLGAGLGAIAAHVVAGLPGVAGFVVPVVGPGLLLQAVLVALLVGFVATLVPVRRATAQSPSQILRGR